MSFSLFAFVCSSCHSKLPSVLLLYSWAAKASQQDHRPPPNGLIFARAPLSSTSFSDSQVPDKIFPLLPPELINPKGK